MKNIYNYSTILSHGDQIRLNTSVDIDAIVDVARQYESHYMPYNPRKKQIERYGLSLKSYTGRMDDQVDLDSLPEYNREHGTDIAEKDINKPTEVYELIKPHLGSLVDIDEHIVRTHILKLPPGGFFPHHRDSVRPNTETMRLILPLYNYRSPRVFFIYENRDILDWRPCVYFLNTHKYHALFNASTDDSLWLVFNVYVNDETIEYVIRNG